MTVPVLLAWSLAAAVAVMTALYLLQRRRGDAGVVDVGWAAGIGLVARRRPGGAGSGDSAGIRW